MSTGDSSRCPGLSLAGAWQATRPLFFPASVLAVLPGAAFAARAGPAIDFAGLALAVAGALAAHAGANALEDYWDHASGAGALHLALHAAR